MESRGREPAYKRRGSLDPTKLLVVFCSAVEGFQVLRAAFEQKAREIEDKYSDHTEGCANRATELGIAEGPMRTFASRARELDLMPLFDRMVHVTDVREARTVVTGRVMDFCFDRGEILLLPDQQDEVVRVQATHADVQFKPLVSIEFVS